MRNSIKRTAAVVLAAVQIAAVLPFQALAQEMDLSNSGSKTTHEKAATPAKVPLLSIPIIRSAVFAAQQ